MSKVYFGNWASQESMWEDFQHYTERDKTPFPEGVEVLFAYYDGGGYDGTAFVLFRKDGKLYEVHGSHCSCYGLEDQWEPEECTVESLTKTTPHIFEYNYNDEAKDRFFQLLKELG
jgi:hypothetical protein